jgi:hypothetical protein
MSRSVFFIVTLFLGCLLLVSAETFEQSQLEEEQLLFEEQAVILGDSVIVPDQRTKKTTSGRSRVTLSPSLIPLPPQATFVPTLLPTLLPRTSQKAPPPPPGANPPSKYLLFSATLNDDRATPLTNGGLGVALFETVGNSPQQPHPLLSVLLRTNLPQPRRAYLIRSPNKIPNVGAGNLNKPDPDDSYQLQLTGDNDFVFYGRVRHTTIDAFLDNQVYAVVESDLEYRVIGKFQNTYPTFLSYLNGTNEVPQTFSQAIGLAGTQIYLNQSLISPMNLVNYTEAFTKSLVADYKIISNIFSEAISAHVHGPARRNMTAPVEITATVMADGIFGTVFPISLDVLRNYNKEWTYSNIHTTLYPGGSIRGQNLPLYFIEDGSSVFNFNVVKGTATGDYSLLSTLEAKGPSKSKSAITLTPAASAGNSSTTFQMTFDSTNNVPSNLFGITGRLLRGVVVTMNLQADPGADWQISIKSLTGKRNFDVLFTYTGTVNFFTGFFFIPVETIPDFINVNSKVWTLNFAITSTGSTPLNIDYIAVNPVTPNGKTNNELGPLITRLMKDVIPPEIKRKTQKTLRNANRNTRAQKRRQRRRRNNRKVL